METIQRNEALTDEDISTLIEALDAWTKRNESGEMMGDLLVAMISEKADKHKIEQERLQRRQQAKIERQVEQDTATLLKAKLIGIRQSRRYA